MAAQSSSAARVQDELAAGCNIICVRSWAGAARGKARRWRRAEVLVARYGKEHKQATRQRIIETAGRRFKRDGIDGSGIATLMADAGLTNGAFYAHFASKDDLVAAVVADQLATQVGRYDSLSPGRPGLEEFAREYLSPQHRDRRDTGCPSAALLDEIGRCPKTTKRAYTSGARAIVDEIAARLAPDDPQAARGQALALFTMMVGTLQLSRALADRRLADEVLEHGLANALALLGAAPDA
jgi:AcrR family transcriptional regulator